MANSFHLGQEQSLGMFFSGSVPSRAVINKQRNGMESRNSMSVHKCVDQGGGKVECWR